MLYHLPALVMIISVPSLLNWSHRLLSSRVTWKKGNFAWVTQAKKSKLGKFCWLQSHKPTEVESHKIKSYGRSRLNFKCLLGSSWCKIKSLCTVLTLTGLSEQMKPYISQQRLSCDLDISSCQIFADSVGSWPQKVLCICRSPNPKKTNTPKIRCSDAILILGWGLFNPPK